MSQIQLLNGADADVFRNNLNSNFDQLFDAPRGLLINTRTVAILKLMPGGDTLVDIDLPTVLSPFSTSDFEADVDGSMKYVGAGLEAKAIFMVALERASGTNAMNLVLLRNDVQFAAINGEPEMTVDSAPKFIFADIDLVTNDIIRSQDAVTGGAINIIEREFYMEITAR